MIKVRLLTIRLVPLSQRNSPVYIAPVVGAALVTGGASLLGDILGFGSSSSANRTNLKIAREQNEFNRAMWEKQRDFTLQQWQMNNEYNSPVEQMKRYKEAGLNPYLMIQPGSAGYSEAMSTPSAAPAAGATVQPYDFHGIGEAGRSAVDAFLGAKQAYIAEKVANSQVDNVDAQTDALRFENLFNTETRTLRLRDYEANVDKHERERDAQRMQNQITFANMPYVFREMRNRVKEQEANISYAQANTMLAAMQTKLLETQNKVAIRQFEEMPIRLKYDIAVSNSQILANQGAAAAGFGAGYASRMQGDYTDAQRRFYNKTEYSRMEQLITGNILNQAQAQHYEVSLKTAMQIAKIQMEQWEIERENLTSGTYMTGQVFRNLISGWLPFSGSVNVSQKLPK